MATAAALATGCGLSTDGVASEDHQSATSIPRRQQVEDGYLATFLPEPTPVATVAQGNDLFRLQRTAEGQWRLEPAERLAQETAFAVWGCDPDIDLAQIGPEEFVRVEHEFCQEALRALSNEFNYGAHISYGPEDGNIYRFVVSGAGYQATDIGDALGTHNAVVAAQPALSLITPGLRFQIRREYAPGDFDTHLEKMNRDMQNGDSELDCDQRLSAVETDRTEVLRLEHNGPFHNFVADLSAVGSSVHQAVYVYVCAQFSQDGALQVAMASSHRSAQLSQPLAVIVRDISPQSSGGRQAPRVELRMDSVNGGAEITTRSAEEAQVALVAVVRPARFAAPAHVSPIRPPMGPYTPVDSITVFARAYADSGVANVHEQVEIVHQDPREAGERFAPHPPPESILGLSTRCDAEQVMERLRHGDSRSDVFRQCSRGALGIGPDLARFGSMYDVDSFSRSVTMLKAVQVELERFESEGHGPHANTMERIVHELTPTRPAWCDDDRLWIGGRNALSPFDQEPTYFHLDRSSIVDPVSGAPVFGLLEMKLYPRARNGDEGVVEAVVWSAYEDINAPYGPIGHGGLCKLIAHLVPCARQYGHTLRFSANWISKNQPIADKQASNYGPLHVGVPPWADGSSPAPYYRSDIPLYPFKCENGLSRLESPYSIYWMPVEDE